MATPIIVDSTRDSCGAVNSTRGSRGPLLGSTRGSMVGSTADSTGGQSTVPEFVSHDQFITVCGMKFPSPMPHGGIASSVFNLSSVMLGAGTLALPRAVQSAGYVTGLLLIALAAGATFFAIRLLVKLAELTGLCSYRDLNRELLGNKYLVQLSELIIIIYCWGLTVVYTVAIGDVLDPLRNVHGMPAAFHGLEGRRLLTFICWALLMLPFSMAKEINSLRYVSALAIFSTVVLASTVVAHTIEDRDELKSPKPFTFDLSTLTSMPVFIFSCTCQANTFEIYGELSERSVNKMGKVVATTLGICCSIYVATGISGVLNFGDAVHGNILKNYHPLADPMMAVSFIGFAFTIAISFPICLLPARDSILHMLGYDDVYSTPDKVRWLVCFVAASASLVLGCLIPNITVCFGIMGGSLSSIIGYILPATMAIRSGEFTKDRVGALENFGVWALLIGGIVAGILGTSTSVYETAK